MKKLKRLNKMNETMNLVNILYLYESVHINYY